MRINLEYYGHSSIMYWFLGVRKLAVTCMFVFAVGLAV